MCRSKSPRPNRVPCSFKINSNCFKKVVLQESFTFRNWNPLWVIVFSSSSVPLNSLDIHRAISRVKINVNFREAYNFLLLKLWRSIWTLSAQILMLRNNSMSGLCLFCVVSNQNPSDLFHMKKLISNKTRPLCIIWSNCCGTSSEKHYKLWDSM